MSSLGAEGAANAGPSLWRQRQDLSWAQPGFLVPGRQVERRQPNLRRELTALVGDCDPCDDIPTLLYVRADALCPGR